MTPRKHRLTVLALAVGVAAIVPTFAQAKLSENAANDRAHHGTAQRQESGPIPYLSHGVGVNTADFGGSAVNSTPQPRVVIPYLSQGVGVNAADFGGSAVNSTPQPRVVIPYLSHGVGVTSAELFGTGPDDRAFARTTVEPAPVVISKEDGWSIDMNGPVVLGLALTFTLLAGGTAVAIWNIRRTRLSAA
jgi:hypothetical protein